MMKMVYINLSFSNTSSFHNHFRDRKVMEVYNKSLSADELNNTSENRLLVHWTEFDLK